MREFSKFIFESFSFNEESLKASFFYSFDDWSEIFEEIIDFGSDKFILVENQLNNKIILNNFLFNLHIALWISYYKLFPTKILEIKSGFLNEEQIIFWKKFYKNWLWEFFIKNDIDFRELINFKNIWKVPDLEKINIINDYINSKNINNNIPPFKGALGGANLLLWWGWKDSIASFSILNSPSIWKREGVRGWVDFDLFVFW
jgi:hypothetical protein